MVEVGVAVEVAVEMSAAVVSWSDVLVSIGACTEAVQWARGVATPERAWQTCTRGDWLLWAAAKLGVERRLLVRAACACARTALEYVHPGEDRPRIAIETAEAWARDDATSQQVIAVARAARAASDAAYESFRVDVPSEAAANAAAYAAYVVRAEANATVLAACAADCAANAAPFRDRPRIRRYHADLVRGLIDLSTIARLM